MTVPGPHGARRPNLSVALCRKGDAGAHAPGLRLSFVLGARVLVWSRGWPLSGSMNGSMVGSMVGSRVWSLVCARPEGPVHTRADCTRQCSKRQTAPGRVQHVLQHVPPCAKARLPEYRCLKRLCARLHQVPSVCPGGPAGLAGLADLLLSQCAAGLSEPATSRSQAEQWWNPSRHCPWDSATADDRSHSRRGRDRRSPPQSDGSARQDPRDRPDQTLPGLP